MYGYDIDDDAIESARALFSARNVPEQRYEFRSRCHSTLLDVARESASVGAVCFNLGYLPGPCKVDRERRPKTAIETTLRAIESALAIVRVGGVVTVVTYVKHEGGADEHEAVAAFLSSLSPKTFDVTSRAVVNRSQAPVFFSAVRVARDATRKEMASTSE